MKFWQKIKNFLGLAPVEQSTEADEMPVPGNTRKVQEPVVPQRPKQVKAPAALQKGVASISYDPGLITRLQEDHQALLIQFTQVNSLVSGNEFESALKELLSFRSKLLNHLHLENLKLYVYLQSSLSNRQEEYAQMRTFRKEMDSIGKIALDFFDKYEKIKISADNKNDFLAEFGAIGGVLAKRIQQEETRLYAMYRGLA